MLFDVFFFLTAAVLIFQGTQAMGEQSSPMGIVPEEVRQDPGKARLRGLILAGYGYLSVVAGLLGYAYGAVREALPTMLYVGFGLMVAYGGYVLFFNRKVEYQAQRAAPANHDHH